MRRDYFSPRSGKNSKVGIIFPRGRRKIPKSGLFLNEVGEKCVGIIFPRGRGKIPKSGLFFPEVGEKFQSRDYFSPRSGKNSEVGIIFLRGRGKMRRDYFSPRSGKNTKVGIIFPRGRGKIPRSGLFFPEVGEKFQ